MVGVDADDHPQLADRAGHGLRVADRLGDLLVVPRLDHVSAAVVVVGAGVLSNPGDQAGGQLRVGCLPASDTPRDR